VSGIVEVRKRRRRRNWRAGIVNGVGWVNLVWCRKKAEEEKGKRKRRGNEYSNDEQERSSTVQYRMEKSM